ncbi:MAG: hypothetical protein GTO22_07405 [Gemmatimonadales bacterium]|nr:hypothetical protein [Gemmatimonadales bacterium]
MGASGEKYTYFIWELPAPLSPGQDGNYIYARQGPQGQWVPIYIGEGELADRASGSHHKADCIRRKGATHFHCHLNSPVEARRAEEWDLLRNYGNAYEPDGCNERPGG